MLIRNHLDKSIAPRHLDSCKPKVVWFQRHAEVVTALRLRQNKSAAEAERKSKRPAPRNFLALVRVIRLPRVY